MALEQQEGTDCHYPGPVPSEVVGKPWSPVEIDAILHSYFRMLNAQLTGAIYVKAAENRSVAEQTGRSRGSVEFKYANVSAALDEFGLVFVDGYKPRSNIQDALRRAVAGFVTTHPEIDVVMRRYVDDTSRPVPDFKWNPLPVEAPSLEPRDTSKARQFLPRSIDYVEREARNRERGLAGEILVFEQEKKALAEAGRPDLAKKVEHVALTQGDGLGFDVLSFSVEGVERFLEVKTTVRGINAPFFVSRNEVEFSAFEPSAFELHRLYGYGRNRAGRYILPGSLTDSCELKATSYSALPRTA